MMYVGIDTGIHTGIAVWCPENQKFVTLATVKIHEAMAIVARIAETDIELHVRFEDARQYLLKLMIASACRTAFSGENRSKV